MWPDGLSDPVREDLRFRGRLGPPSDGSPDFTAIIQYHRFDPTVLNVELSWLGDEQERRSGYEQLHSLPYNYVWLNGTNPKAPMVELRGISGVGCEGHREIIRASAIQVNITEEIVSEDWTFHVTAQLQPSGIVIDPGVREMSYTGDIRVKRYDQRQITLSTPFGELEVAERYEHYSSSEFGDEVTHSVRRAAVSGDIVLPAGTHLYALNERLWKVLRHVCLGLTLSYRQMVRCYEVRYLPDLERRDEHPAVLPFFRCQLAHVDAKSRRDELINFGSLVDGGLERLLGALRDTPDADALARAIHFLGASYDATVETAFFMAFAAMETLVDSCVPSDNRSLLARPERELLGQKLRDALEMVADEHARRVMISRLPGFFRDSFPDKVRLACDRFGPPTKDLWPDKTFDQGLRHLNVMRNRLFHAASYDDIHDMAADLVRVRTLTERLLLKKIDWPDDRIWRWYDQNLKWLNKT